MSEEGIAAGAPAPAVRVDPITGLVDAPPRKLDDASPRPWRVETNRFGQHYVVCESGSGDRVRDYIAGPIQNESDARLIVDAVNERDRLRDIVKRMADKLEVHRGIFTGAGVYSQTAQEETSRLLNEARAAIGEEKP